MNSKIAKFVDAFRKGSLNDAQIARMAKVTEAEVAAARLEFNGPPVVASAPVAAPVEPVEPVADVEPAEAPAEVAVAPVEAVVAVPEVVVEVAPEPETESAPKTVRVTVTRNVIGPTKRPLHLGFRAVYSGEMASWLWANHRDVVEEYPPKPKG